MITVIQIYKSTIFIHKQSDNDKENKSSNGANLTGNNDKHQTKATIRLLYKMWNGIKCFAREINIIIIIWTLNLLHVDTYFPNLKFLHSSLSYTVSCYKCKNIDLTKLLYKCGQWVEI